MDDLDATDDLNDPGTEEDLAVPEITAEPEPPVAAAAALEPAPDGTIVTEEGSFNDPTAGKAFPSFRARRRR